MEDKNKLYIVVLTGSLVLIFLVVLMYFLSDYINHDKTYENYGTGAILQLVAKGPMDTYLTGDAEKYIPPWYYYNPRFYSFGHLYYPYYAPDQIDSPYIRYGYNGDKLKYVNYI